MSKIPMIGPNGTTWIETDPDPPTQEEVELIDWLHAESDHNFTLIWQNKLAALGLPCSYEEASAVYRSSFEEREKINNEYHKLVTMNIMAEACGRLEKLHRELRGKEL